MLKNYIAIRSSYRLLATQSSHGPPGRSEDKGKRMENLQKGFGETARTVKDMMPGISTPDEEKPSTSERVHNIKTGFQETARTIKEGVESFMPGHNKKEHDENKGIAGAVFDGVNKTIEGVAGAVKSVFQGSPSQEGSNDTNKSQSKHENERKSKK